MFRRARRRYFVCFTDVAPKRPPGRPSQQQGTLGCRRRSRCATSIWARMPCAVTSVCRLRWCHPPPYVCPGAARAASPPPPPQLLPRQTRRRPPASSTSPRSSSCASSPAATPPTSPRARLRAAGAAGGRELRRAVAVILGVAVRVQPAGEGGGRLLPQRLHRRRGAALVVRKG